MKGCIIVRKAAYRLPGTGRKVWCIVLTENEGLALLFVRSLEKDSCHQLTIASETAEGVFEAVNASSFPINRPQLLTVTATLATLGDEMAEDEIDEFLKSGGLR
jgi:hypothetical protein